MPIPSSRPRIAVLRPYPDAVLAALAELGEVLKAPMILQGEAAAAHLASADALLVNPGDPVTEAMLAAAPSLKAISSISAGLDHIDLAACERRGIKVANAPDPTTEPTADLAFGLILAAARRLTAADAYVRNGQWIKGAPPFWGLDVHHRTLGVVGMGRIGKAIARRAAAFSMSVIYHNRRPIAGEEDQWRDLDSLLAEADVVVLQTPLTPQTRGLIGARELGLMKPTAILVNTGRGGVVDEDALADALEEGKIAQAALDVFDVEPLAAGRLLTAPNLILAPHIGTATHASRAAMAAEAISNLGQLLRA